MAQEPIFFKLKKILKGERNWDSALNKNFDEIDGELKNVNDRQDDINQRLNNMVAGAGDSNTEIVDSRLSMIKNKTFQTLQHRLEEIESDIRSLMGFLQFEAKNYDEDLEVDTLIEYRDTNGKLRIVSELKNIVNGNYDTQEIKIYDVDGLTLRKTVTFKLEYKKGRLSKRTAVSIV